MGGNRGTTTKGKGVRPLNAGSSKSEETKKKENRDEPEPGIMSSSSESLRDQVTLEQLPPPALHPQPFKCPKCPETFATKRELAKHMLQRVRAWVIDLELCMGPVPASTPCYTRSNISEPEVYVCDKCKVTFRCVPHFLYHMGPDATCDVEKCPKCNENFERGGLEFLFHKLSHRVKNHIEERQRIMDEYTVQTEMDVHECPPTYSLPPSVSNPPLIDLDSSGSKETGLDENGVIHIQPVKTLRGPKVVGVPLSVFKDGRVRALMKELDPSLDFSKLEDGIGIGMVDSGENKKDGDDSNSQVVDVEPNPPVHEQEVDSSVMDLSLPKTHRLDYEDYLEKLEIARRRRKRRSRLVGKPYLFQDRTPTDTQAVHAMRWDRHITNPTPWTQLPQELAIDEDFFKTVKPVWVKAIEHQHAIDLCRKSKNASFVNTICG